MIFYLQKLITASLMQKYSTGQESKFTTPLAPIFTSIFLLGLAVIQEYSPSLLHPLLLFLATGLYLSFSLQVFFAPAATRFIKWAALIFFFTGIFDFLYLIQGQLQNTNAYDYLWLFGRLFFFSSFFLLSLTKKSVFSFRVIFYATFPPYLTFFLIQFIWPQLFMQFKFTLHSSTGWGITPMLFIVGLGIFAFVNLRNPPHVAALRPLSYWNTAFLGTLIAEALFLLGQQELLPTLTLSLLLKSATGLVLYWSFQQMLQTQNSPKLPHQLVSSFNHELNNLLYALSLNLELIANETQNQPPAATYIQNAQEAQQCMAQKNKRTQEIIALSLQSQQRMQLVHWLREILTSQPEFTQVKYSLELPEDLNRIYVSGNPTQITNVLTELLTNAQEAAKEKGAGQESIEIKISPEMKLGVHYLVVSLKNVSEEFPPQKALTPFYSTKPNGLGLGLSYVQSVMQFHQGHFQLETNHNSTIAKCYFPILEA